MTSLVLAAVLSLAIGGALGLLGGGGSILTVPILVYALGVDEKSAIASSLLVVGVTSAVAAIQYARARSVVWRVALVFAGAGMIGAYAGGRVAVYVPSSVLLVVFASIMMATAFAMWRGRTAPADADAAHATAKSRRSLPLLKMLVEGLVVGTVTGFVGAGGGFLVVPALALRGGLPMRQAIGSSLVVIAFQSFAGYAGHASHVDVNWTLTSIVAAAAVAGSFISAPLGKRIPQATLRRGFAIFVVAMAVFIVAKQL